MANLEWRPEFSVGDEALDQQHRKILEIINKLQITVTESGEDGFTMDHLTELMQYADDHFITEENVLAQTGYPDLRDHEEEHLAYRERVLLLGQKLQSADAETGRELLEFARTWWVEHIQETDLRYRKHLQGERVDEGGRESC